MMLTDYITYPTPQPGKKKVKKKDKPVEDGQRSKATEFFDGLTAKAELLKTTVLLHSDQAFASGVILGVDDTKAYILTAKHNLFILAGQVTPVDKRTGNPKTPGDYTIDDYGRFGIQIGYKPTGLLLAPEDPPKTSTVKVSGFNFLGVDDSSTSWSYDAMLFECTNTDFYTYVNTNRFIKHANYEEYSKALDRSKGKYQLLDRRLLDHIQLGYGKARDEDLDINRDNYTSYERKIQCKQSFPSTVTTSPVELLEPKSSERDRNKWRRMLHAIELDADVTKSTGPGDSGGPLFAVKGTKFALMGVTSGANFYSQKSKWDRPPGDRLIHNNVVTYWHEIFKKCAFLDRP